MLPVESWARGYKTGVGAHDQLRAQTHISCSAELTVGIKCLEYVLNCACRFEHILNGVLMKELV